MRRGLTSRLSLWRGDRVVALALIGRRPLLAGQFALTSIFQPRLLHKRPMSGKGGGILLLWQCQPHHFPRPTGASVRFCNLHRCIGGSSFAPRIFLAAKRHASSRALDYAELARVVADLVLLLPACATAEIGNRSRRLMARRQHTNARPDDLLFRL